MYKMAQSYLVDGNIYLLRKSIDTLDVLFPQYVQITRSALGFKLYNYALTGETFTENQIIHTFAPQYDDGEKGHSIIEVDRDLIELDNLLYLYIDTYFRNSAGERVVFKLQEGVYKDLKTEAIQKEFDRYLQEKVNAFAAGKPFTLKSGIEIESITQTTNKESELQSLLDRVEAKIALALLFPQSLATGNYGNNLIEQQNQYARQCLFPITEVQKEGLNRLLTPEERVYLSFEYGFDNLLMPITKELYEMVIDAARGGILTKNEGRRLLKLPRYTGDQSEVGDVLAWESNLVPALNKNLDLYFANAQQTIEKDKKKSENANPNTK
jgi:HK97 family phage portal protein